MKNLLLITTFIIIGLSCKKETTVNEDHNTHLNGCDDLIFSNFSFRNEGISFTLNFDSSSTREPISYPGFRFLNELGDTTQVEYSYWLDIGVFDYGYVSIPDSIRNGCEWTIELVQLHSEDSVICSATYKKCLN